LTVAPHRHTIRPRYGEIDMQGVVFNAHYLAYCDDACDSWFRSRLGRFEDLGFDFMLKKAEITWAGATRLGDVLDIDVAVRRWGTTSFDAGFDGKVGDRAVFDAVITYVSVVPKTVTPAPVPDVVRERLGDG
jgi:acyl-CoA thioester hydrolase